MRNTYIIILAAFLTMSFSAAAQTIDGSIDASDIKVTHTGTSVRLEMILRINDDAVSKCQSVAVIPTLVNGAQSATFPYVLVNGAKAKQIYERRNKFGFTELRENPPYQVVNIGKKLVGGTAIAYDAELPAAAWTSGASLKLGILLLSCAGERQYYAMETFAGITIPLVAEEIKPWRPATKVIPETEPVVQETTPDIPLVTEEPKPAEHYSNGCAYLDFQPDSDELLFYYGRNAREMTEIRRVFDKIKNTPGARITELSITGYASPEGRYANNEKLAYDRTFSLAKYLQYHYGISVRYSTVSAVAEDWDKLRELVAASNIAHKYEILAIIDSPGHPDAKESKLRRLAGGVPWKIMIDTMFPQLRRVEYKVTYSFAE